MKETINDLWRGKIHPYDDNAQKYLAELELKKFIDSHRSFMDSLDENGKTDLLFLIESLEKVWSDACDDAFEKGFSLGIKLASESLR